jgi:DNA-binding MarR family transcriptional regulator
VYYHEMEKHPIFEALRHSTDACACTALRKATRVAAQLYDRHLEQSGLTTAQFSLLAALYYAQSIPMKRLAARLAMERTSLTRILAPLEKKGLVEIKVSAEDARVRMVTITALGLERLISALPLWQEAQAKMEKKLGKAGWDQLRASLQQAVAAARAAGSTL